MLSVCEWDSVLSRTIISKSSSSLLPLESSIFGVVFFGL